LVLEPDNADTLVKLGNVLRDIGFNHRRALEQQLDSADGSESPAEPESHPGLWDEVFDCTNRVLSQVPGDMAALGLKTSALIGLDRYDDWALLCDFESLMQAQTISVPSGYADLASFNEEILERCVNDPTLIKKPCESMTAGQRIYNLQNQSKLGPSHPLLEFMNEAAKRYHDEHPIDSRHPFLAQRPDNWRLDVWGSILDGEGQMKPHNHPEAWLSGVYYAKLPDVIESENQDHDGWIEFGRPPNFLSNRAEPPFRLVQPKEGLLLLWPSYFFHQTVPYASGGTRFSIAVDVVPA